MAALGFFLLQAASGLLMLRFFDPLGHLPVILRLLLSCGLGVIASGYVMLGLALLTRSLRLAILVTAMLMLLGLGAMAVRHRSSWSLLARQLCSLGTAARRQPVAVGFIILLVSVTLVLQVQVLLPQPPFLRSIRVGWGDVALHLGIIRRLAVANPFLLEHPMLAGHALSYPFFGHFLSAVALVLDGSDLLAYHLPVLFFGAVGVLLLFGFYQALTGRTGLAVLLSSWVLLGAGLGWLWFAQDVHAAYDHGGIAGVLAAVNHLPHEYTHLDNRTGGKPPGFDSPHNIVWLVPVLSFLTHQRTFPLGLTVGLMVLLGALYYRHTRYFPRYGVLLGLLPLIHIHTFVAMAVLFAGLGVAELRYWKRYLLLALVAGLIAAPALAYLLSESSPMIRGWWGWMTCGHRAHWWACDTPAPPGTDTSVLWFWTKNFGFVFLAWVGVVLASLLGWLRRGKKREVASEPALPLVAPSLGLFLTPNFVVFQAWEFDNNKLFFWWWILAIAVIGHALARIRSLRQLYAVAGPLAGVILLAGTLDVSMRLRHFTANHFAYVGEAEMAAAQWIIHHTEPNVRMIGGTGANHFVPILTGRPLALGFEGWLWSQGVDYLARRRQIQALAQGNSSPACADQLSYVVVDASFYRAFRVNKAAFRKHLTRVWRQETLGGTREIYQIDCPP